MIHYSISYPTALTLSALVALVIAARAWRTRPAPGAQSIALLMMTVAIWSLGYAAEFSIPDLAGKILWAKVQYFGIAFIPVAWLAFGLHYSGRGAWLTSKRLALLAMIPTLTLALVWTNEYHGLVWSRVNLVSANLALNLGHAPFFWLQWIFAYVLLVVGSVYLLKAPVRFPRLYTSQRLVLIFGVALPWVANALYVVRLLPDLDIDLTPFAFSISGVAFLWGLILLQLLNLIPIAHEIALESIDEGVIVLNEKNIAVAINPSAQSMLGVQTGDILRRPAAEILAAWPALFEWFSQAASDNSHVELVLPQNKRYIKASMIALFDQRGYLAGQLIVLRDITEYKWIENALRTREKFLELLNDITRTALEAADIHCMLQLLADRLAGLFDSSACYITLWDEQNQLTIPAAASSPPLSSYQEMISEPGQRTLTMSVMEAGRPLAVEDAHNTPYISPEVSAKFQSASLLGLPIIAGEHKFGAIIIAYNQLHTITEEELSRGLQVSAQISLAIARAALLEETVQRAKSFETLNAELEIRVRERTSQLETMNRQLADEIVERSQIQEQIRERLTMEQALSHITALYLNTQNFDLATSETLKVAGEVAGASRSYLFQFKQNGLTMDNTHEWCAEGVKPQKGILQQLPTSIFPWWMGQLRTEQAIHLEELDDLPPEATAEKKYLQAQDIQSLLVYPVHAGGDLAGFIGFDNIYHAGPWAEEDLIFMKIFAQVVGSAIYRKSVEQELESERASLASQVEERTARLSAANAQLTQALRAKDEFLATMSHELRTPLNAILGLSQALQEEVYGALNDDQIHSLSTIEESGSHLLDLINDILDLSKIEAGMLELQIDPVSIAAICQSSLNFVHRQAAQKSIRLSSRLEAPFDEFPADARRLKQILVNLLTNAVKFTPDGGSVGLEVTHDAEQNRLMFSVWDTGIGISEENLARLFQPFMQIDSGLSRRHEGTGLGLALVKRLTSLHGGNVSLLSSPEKGSRFTISLPVKPMQLNGDVYENILIESILEPAPGKQEIGQASEPPTAAVVEAASSGDEEYGSTKSGAMILLAEDNETNIKMITDYLHYNGYKIRVARNGIEAIEIADAENPSLIFMDIQMPEMDGLEATRILRTRRALDHTPIIALTAMAMTGDRESCLAAGANEYLAKPVNLKQMLESVRGYLDKERALILIVDDSQAGRDTVKALLTAENYRMAFAVNGLQALQLAAELLPDVILLDVMMPDMDGFEVCRRIRSDARLADIPIILLTALDDRSSRLLGIQSGADEFITKPFDRLEMRARLRTLTRLNRYRRMNDERSRFENLIELSPSGILLLDAQGAIQLANYAARSLLTSEDTASLAGKNFFDFCIEGEQSKTSGWFFHLVNDQIRLASAEMSLRAVSGALVPVNIYANTLDWKNHRHIQVLVYDIREQKALRDRLTYLAMFDDLTHLPNRNLLDERLASAILQNHPNQANLGLVHIDVDNFHTINQIFGVPAGDQILEQIACRLQQQVRCDDTLARISADEFVVLLTPIESEANLIAIAERLLEVFNRPFYLSNQEIYLTAKAGLSQFPADGSDSAALLRSASIALTFSKASRQNHYQRFQPSMNDLLVEQERLKYELRQALEQNELVLYFQPQVRLKDQQISGVEALVRWQHPQRGLVSPSEFIRLAEETGLILDLGRWVLEAACRQIAAWQNSLTCILPIAVNISPVQFCSSGVVSDVLGFISKYSIDPCWLAVEVTESAIMHDPEGNSRRLQQLRDARVRIDLDDFGTAYSSLSLLRQLPVDRLKIAREFVSDLAPHSPTAASSFEKLSPSQARNSSAFINAIITLGHSLNLDVLAEGIETEAQLQILRDLGCEQGQGYLFHRPMPERELFDLLCTNALPVGRSPQ